MLPELLSANRNFLVRITAITILNLIFLALLDDDDDDDDTLFLLFAILLAQKCD